MKSPAIRGAFYCSKQFEIPELSSIQQKRGKDEEASIFVPMRPTKLIDSTQFGLIVDRLAHELLENHRSFESTVLLGIQPRGVYLARRIKKKVESLLPGVELRCGDLDITFFRDDFRRREKPLQANTTKIDFVIEDRNVVLVDDVLYTGRTIRAAMDAMLSFGRPRSVELMVLIDRRFSRELPIEPQYVGKAVDSLDHQRVHVTWNEVNGKDLVELHSIASDEPAKR
jgi:pyrimidine operon attenuation protein/uracil phosphoribosyltransferase